MRLCLIFFVVVSFCTNVNGQELKGFTHALKDVRESDEFTGILMSINMPDFIKGSEQLNNIYRYFELRDDDSVYSDAVVDAIKKDSLLIDRYVSSLKNFGNQNGVVNPVAKKKLRVAPITYAMYRDSLVFIQHGLYYDNRINTSKLNPNERAFMVIDNLLVPSLFNFEPLLDSSSVDYFCLAAGYTTLDFREKIESLTREVESVAILVKKDILQSYIEAELSESELMKNIMIFNCHLGTNGNFRRLQ